MDNNQQNQSLIPAEQQKHKKHQLPITIPTAAIVDEDDIEDEEEDDNGLIHVVDAKQPDSNNYSYGSVESDHQREDAKELDESLLSIESQREQSTIKEDLCNRNDVIVPDVPSSESISHDSNESFQLQNTDLVSTATESQTTLDDTSTINCDTEISETKNMKGESQHSSDKPIVNSCRPTSQEFNQLSVRQQEDVSNADQILDEQSHQHPHPPRPPSHLGDIRPSSQHLRRKLKKAQQQQKMEIDDAKNGGEVVITTSHANDAVTTTLDQSSRLQSNTKSGNVHSNEPNKSVNAIYAGSKEVEGNLSNVDNSGAEGVCPSNSVLTEDHDFQTTTSETAAQSKSSNKESPLQEVSMTDDKMQGKQEGKNLDQDEVKRAASISSANNTASTGVAFDGTDGNDVAVEKMDPSFMYEEDGQSVAQVAGEWESDAFILHHSFGSNLLKMDNLHVLDKETIAYGTGAYVVLLQLATGNQEYLRTASGQSVSALTVHPSRTFLAVADQGNEPTITVFGYPSKQRYRILRGGAVYRYANMCFDKSGNMLASVAGAPDYRLTVWDWRNEAIILRTKAFSSDVSRVTFSAFNTGQLTTSGQGHIRFWKMAKTFTGLKLQGQIGKFGRTELSDIYGYVEFPDGKVLSGTEWGNLLLWEGGFIKCEIAREGGKLCHQGAVETVIILEESGDIATAGADGHVRVWDFETLDGADRPHDSPYFEMEPIYERRLSPRSHVRSLTKSMELGEEESETVYYAQDVLGHIWRVDLAASPTTGPAICLATFHRGSISDIACSPRHNLAVSAGLDGRLRLYDYVERKTLVTWISSELPYLSCHCVTWATASVDRDLRTIFAGFSDGVVRAFRIATPKELVLQGVAKPFTGAVHFLVMVPTGKCLCAISNDATTISALVSAQNEGKLAEIKSACSHSRLDKKQGDNKGSVEQQFEQESREQQYKSVCFFLNVDDALCIKPIGFVFLKDCVNRARCSPDSKSILFACDNAHVLEINIPDSSYRESTHTFELTQLDSRCFTFNSIMHLLEPEPEVEQTEKQSEGGGSKGEELNHRGDALTKEKGKMKPKQQKTIPKFLPTNSPILDAWYSTSSNVTLMLLVGGDDAGYVYECSWEMPEKPLRAHDVRTNQERAKCAAAVDKVLQAKTAAISAANEKTESSSVGYQTVGVSSQTTASVVRATAPSTTKSIPKAIEYSRVEIQQTYLSSDTSTILFVGSDGSVRAFALPNFTSHWCMGMLDEAKYPCSHITMSCDAEYVVVAGSDGSLFVLKNRLHHQKKDLASFALPVHDMDPINVGSPVADILDPSRYSFEEDLQRTEVDMFLQAAEEKKHKMLASISALRREFERLLLRNEGLPASQRLPAEAFIMNSSLQHDMEERKREAVAELDRFMAWDLEKAHIANKKLRDHFMGDLAHPRIVVCCINRPEAVASFRCSHLSEMFTRTSTNVLRSVSKVQSMAKRARKTVARRAEQSLLEHSDEHDVMVANNDDNSDNDKHPESEVHRPTSLSARTGVSPTISSAHRMFASQRGRQEAERHKIEKRRKDREELRKRMEELLQQKPNRNKIDPSDEQKLKHLRQNMGDYKLKTSSDYFVPVSERVNTAKKREQIIALRQRIHDAKNIFNSHVFTLRKQKQLSIEKIKVCRELLRVLNVQLGRSNTDLPDVPTMSEEEFPENKDQVTPEKLSEFRIAFEKQLLAEKDAAKQARGGGFGGFGGFGGNTSNQKQESQSTPREEADDTSSIGTHDTSSTVRTARPSLVEVARPRRRSTIYIPASLIGTSVADSFAGDDTSRMQRELAMESERLHCRIKKIIRDFDEMVLQLLRTKRDTELRIKFAEYMHVLCYQELVHLQVFDIREQELEQVKEVKEYDHHVCEAAHNKAKKSMTDRQKDISRLQAQEKQLNIEFSSIVSDGHPFAKFLTKMFRRKVKRRHTKKTISGKEDALGGEDAKDHTSSDEEEEEDDESDNDDDQADDFSDDEFEDFDDSVCPSGCDPAAYKKVEALRERRLDIEERLSDVKRQADAFKKDVDSTSKRLKVLEAAVERAECEIAAFQVEKQRKLNELHVAVPLKASQVFFKDDHWLPKDFSKALVFAKQGIHKSQCTINQLQDEKNKQRLVFKDIRSRQARLQRELQEKELENKEFKRKCEEMQHLKFGRIVDLDELDAGSASSKQADQLRELQVDIEFQHDKELVSLDLEISRYRQELSHLIRQNTAILSDLTDLKKDKSLLEEQLDYGSKVLHTSCEDEKLAHDQEELQRLQDLADIQQQEMAHLHSELRRLTHKGGEIVLPYKDTAVTPLPRL